MMMNGFRRAGQDRDGLGDRMERRIVIILCLGYHAFYPLFVFSVFFWFSAFLLHERWG